MSNIDKKAFVESLKYWRKTIKDTLIDNPYTRGKLDVLEALIKEINLGKHDKKYKYGG